MKMFPFIREFRTPEFSYASGVVGACVLVCFSLMCSGCAGVKNTMRVSEKDSQWNPVKVLAEEKVKETKPSPATSMTILWKESVYETAGKMPTRGFGGRVFFYDAANNAVEVEGELTVYGFDETSNSGKPGVPDKKFVFTNEQLQELASDSGLGKSYSIWVPWDEVGGMRKTIALIPMLKTADGRLLKSGQSLGILPGKVMESTAASSDRPYAVLGSSPAVFEDAHQDPLRARPVSQVNYQEASSKPKLQPNRIKTSTIKVNRGLAQRMGQVQAAKPVEETATSQRSPLPPITPVPVSPAERMLQKHNAQLQVSQPSETSSTIPGRARVFGSPGSF